MGRNMMMEKNDSDLENVSLKEYANLFEPMTIMVIEAICQFCKYAQVDTSQVEKSLSRYILYRDFTGFSGFFSNYAKEKFSLEMIEKFNALTQNEMENLFVSLEDAFSVIPRELIYG